MVWFITRVLWTGPSYQEKKKENQMLKSDRRKRNCSASFMIGRRETLSKIFKELILFIFIC